MQALRARLESKQLTVYFCTIALAVAVGVWDPGATALESLITPMLAVMLYATFLQVPMAELGRVSGQARFLSTLLIANFVAIPVLVMALVQFLPADPMLRLGVLLVLLAPCIDYVVTFAQLGQADAKRLLAATPVLLVVQMALLPVYLGLFLGGEATTLVKMAPFVHAFVWLILLPAALAAMTQVWAARGGAGRRTAEVLGLLPVPATAVVLFVVVAAVIPQLGAAAGAAMRVVPVYLAFAVIAPCLGWTVARCARLDVPARRAVAFSSATRNSLVVLPLALAVPGAVPLLPAVIVTQTMVELVSELVYIRVLGRLPSRR